MIADKEPYISHKELDWKQFRIGWFDFKLCFVYFLPHIRILKGDK